MCRCACACTACRASRLGCLAMRACALSPRTPSRRRQHAHAGARAKSYTTRRAMGGMLGNKKAEPQLPPLRLQFLEIMQREKIPSLKTLPRKKVAFKVEEIAGNVEDEVTRDGHCPEEAAFPTDQRRRQSQARFGQGRKIRQHPNERRRTSSKSSIIVAKTSRAWTHALQWRLPRTKCLSASPPSPPPSG